MDLTDRDIRADIAKRFESPADTEFFKIPPIALKPSTLGERNFKMAIKKRYSTDDPKAQPDSYYRILSLFSDLCNRFGKYYCFPSMATISDLLEKRYDRRLERRQIFNAIIHLVASGQVKKINRHCKGPSGELQLHSNLYVMLSKGFYLLKRYRNQLTNRPLFKKRDDYPKPRRLIDPLKEMFKDQDRTGMGNDEIKPIGDIFSSPILQT